MIRWNYFAGTAILPTLARLVLAMAFITTGLHKIKDTTTYSKEDAQILNQEFGIKLEPIVIQPAAFLQDAPAEPDQPSPADKALDAMKTAAQDVADAAQKSAETDQPEGEMIEIPPPAEFPGETPGEIPAENPDAKNAAGNDAQGEYRGKAIFQLMLLLHENNFPSPYWMAWVAALTEFVGGILILIGLFSRVWGLGLTVAMATAFYLTNMDRYFGGGNNPFEVAATDLPLFNSVFTQLGLGLLALMIFLVGPGPLSLDRLIFRSRDTDSEVVDDVEMDAHR